MRMIESSTKTEEVICNTENEVYQDINEELFEENLKVHIKYLARDPKDQTIKSILDYSKSLSK